MPSVALAKEGLSLWASDGTANFAKHKILAGRHSATAKDALRSLGEGGPFPWASDGTANFAKHKIRAGRYSATAKDALRSLGEGGLLFFTQYA